MIHTQSLSHTHTRINTHMHTHKYTDRTTLRQHPNSYEHGTPHQILYVLEGVNNVVFLQFYQSFTICDLK